MKGIKAKGVIDTADRTRESRTHLSLRDCDRPREARYRRATTHHGAITDPMKVGALLRAIDAYGGQAITAAALKLAPYVFVRPSKLRAVEWSEIVLDGDEELFESSNEFCDFSSIHQCKPGLGDASSDTAHSRVCLWS